MYLFSIRQVERGFTLPNNPKYLDLCNRTPRFYGVKLDLTTQTTKTDLNIWGCSGCTADLVLQLNFYNNVSLD